MSVNVKPLIDSIGRDGFIAELNSSQDVRAAKLLMAYKLIEEVLVDGETSSVQTVASVEVEIAPELKLRREAQELIIAIALRKDLR